MPAPICVQCQMAMRCKQNDRLVNDVRAAGFPPTYWRGDLFRCPQCNTEIVVRFGCDIDELMLASLRKAGVALQDSLAFAYGPEQREQYADQFKKRSETP